MKTFTLILAFFISLFSHICMAQSDQQAISDTLNDYIQGTSFNDQSRIKNAFQSDALLHLQKTDQANWVVKASDYIGWFKEENKGKFNGRIGEILDIDIAGNIATAKVEILVPAKSLRYTDLFLLKKLDKRWQIISKSASSDTSNRNGKRILFIASSAYFHGETQLPAGVSFSEIVIAYHTFKQAGYTVDFVSPDGGALPLAYINTSMPLHKQYLYDSDFMFAIGNSKTPQQINPADYVAVHYLGGTNAMYGVADNQQIQAISMAIYERHGGIISSVCHGTAGIVNLRTQDGQYLVSGKRISGYPEDYENQSKAYFAQFPFLIKQSVELHGGTFLYSPRNTPHVEVDGRIVTGQNYLSSQAVAEQIIQLLEK
ncbi:nuclear transport factor 2 family protein [Neptunicella marina]|uniref:Nuclear transport factor 2 family protein n=1 Tax=Neptunicella marina TaxID=2125989 RepID=A0A8J6M1J4_9ALTE|nr:nuclear transport factor 2 family protein [Neptunicella marina]MBC3765548.1 nuclear transport factor 2 family protein [Neptunicella marina]